MAAVIFLNGTSSSGKTTLAEMYQRLAPEPVLYASVDSFIFMLSDEVLADDELRPQLLPPVVRAFHRALPLLASCGPSVIVDHVLEQRSWLEECLLSLREHTVYFVGLHCPIEQLEARERQRQDRQLGLARKQAAIVHRHCCYDLEIDTALTCPEDAAHQLLGLLRCGLPPTAFEQMRRRLVGRGSLRRSPQRSERVQP
ncbi:MAG: chloramphenicol phosphotransferase CPT family protein [Opitutales bacterium]